jgi:hypothetical protein
MLKKRAKDLEEGITELLGDDPTKSFVGKLYDHGLINGLYRGNYATTPKTKLPSHIPSRNFALALISNCQRPDEHVDTPQERKIRSGFVREDRG